MSAHHAAPAAHKTFSWIDEQGNFSRTTKTLMFKTDDKNFPPETKAAERKLKDRIVLIDSLFFFETKLSKSNKVYPDIYLPLTSISCIIHPWHNQRSFKPFKVHSTSRYKLIVLSPHRQSLTKVFLLFCFDIMTNTAPWPCYFIHILWASAMEACILRCLISI